MTSTVQAVIESHQLLVSFENLLLAEHGCSVTASSTASTSGETAADHVPANLLVPELDLAWRSSSIAGLPAGDAAVVRLKFTLGAPTSVGWVSLHRHNVRVPWAADLYRADPDGSAPPIASSPWTDPIVRAAFEDYTFDDFDPSLGPDFALVETLTSLFRLDSPISFDQVYDGIRYVVLRFDVSSGANGARDYLQVAHPRAGRAFRPVVNMVLDWGIGVVDRTVTRRTESGSKRGRRKTTGRTLDFSLGYLDREEAFRRLLTDWMRESGTLGLGFFWPEPAQRQHFYDQAILGQIETMGRVAMTALEVPSGRGFSIEEAE